MGDRKAKVERAEGREQSVLNGSMICSRCVSAILDLSQVESVTVLEKKTM